MRERIADRDVEGGFYSAVPALCPEVNGSMAPYCSDCSSFWHVKIFHFPKLRSVALVFSGPVSRTSLMVEEILWLHFSLNMAMPFFTLALFAGS